MNNWKSSRERIRSLMKEVNNAKEGSQQYQAANNELNRELKQQPWGRRFNALYR